MDISILEKVGANVAARPPRGLTMVQMGRGRDRDFEIQGHLPVGSRAGSKDEEAHFGYAFRQAVRPRAATATAAETAGQLDRRHGRRRHIPWRCYFTRCTPRRVGCVALMNLLLDTQIWL